MQVTAGIFVHAMEVYTFCYVWSTTMQFILEYSLAYYHVLLHAYWHWVYLFK